MRRDCSILVARGAYELPSSDRPLYRLAAPHRNSMGTAVGVHHGTDSRKNLSAIGHEDGSFPVSAGTRQPERTRPPADPLEGCRRCKPATRPILRSVAHAHDERVCVRDRNSWSRSDRPTGQRANILLLHLLHGVGGTLLFRSLSLKQSRRIRELGSEEREGLS